MTKSKKIAYCGVSAAIGILMIVASRFFPSTMFYIVAAIALYIALLKCGVGYSILTYLVVSGAGLAISIQTAIPYIILIAPHVYLSYALNKLLKIKQPILYYGVRGLIVAAFFSAGFIGVYFLASTALVDMPKLEQLMGLPLLMILGAILFAIYDIACTTITQYIVSRIETS